MWIALLIVAVVAPLYWFAWDARKSLKHMDEDYHARNAPPRSLADEGHLED